MRLAQTAAVSALGFLGMVGGCLVLSQNGFTTSGKRGGHVVFIPAPESFVMAAILLLLSVLALIWLLRELVASRTTYIVATGLYVCAAIGTTKLLSTVLH